MQEIWNSISSNVVNLNNTMMNISEELMKNEIFRILIGIVLFSIILKYIFDILDERNIYTSKRRERKYQRQQDKEWEEFKRKNGTTDDDYEIIDYGDFVEYRRK